MPKMPLSPDAALQNVLKNAAAFRAAHAATPGVTSTYGYFTSHPVAPLNRKRLGLMLAAIDARATLRGRALRVLDLACGGGLIATAIASMGHRTLGLDLRDDEIGLARAFTTEAHGEARFDTADLLDDPTWEQRATTALSGTPDVVVLAYALHHFPRVEEFVARLSRYLEPGTLVLVNEENPESAIFRLKHRVRTWIQNDTDVEWHRTYSGWKTLLDQNHFTTSAPQGADLLPFIAGMNPAGCWSLVFTAERGA
jgi:2-polyprenyl-3-methyl-5-hydroxy-6-metoxy-1,4-benzoquinol methylase